MNIKTLNKSILQLLAFFGILLLSNCDNSTEPKDCAGVSGGSAFIDDCGVCISVESGLIENYLMDCAGICAGISELDNCGVCDDDVSNDCLEDCANVWGGTATLDECGNCDNDPTNDCIQDCHGEWGGEAFLDDCGVCSGGSTGHDANSDQDCNGDCFGYAFINACDYCVGGTTGLPDEYCDPVTDIDGNEYETIVIGDQVWMAKNLKVTHYGNGDEIPTGFTNSEWSQLNDTEMGAFAIYNDDPANAEIYGNLYNWYSVNDSRGVCPEGFHIPSDEEWTILAGFLGGSAGSQLAGNADLWNSGVLVDNPAFGTSGFLALPGGDRTGHIGNYNHMGYNGYFWSSTAGNSSHAWNRVLDYYNSEVYRNDDYLRYGFSIRCLED